MVTEKRKASGQKGKVVTEMLKAVQEEEMIVAVKEERRINYLQDHRRVFLSLLSPSL